MTNKAVEKLLIDLALVEPNGKSENTPLIKVDGLSVVFNRGNKVFEAVKNANLDIQQGEILGLVGESGSGKTTLGRSILGLWDHSKGHVKINDKLVPENRIKSVDSKNIWVYRNGQMIFQDPTSSLNRQEKVFDIVNEGLKNFGTIKWELEQEKLRLENEIFALKDEIKVIVDAKYEEEIKRNELATEELIKLLKTSNKAQYLEFVSAYAKAKELDEKLSEIKTRISELKNEHKKNINILKKQVKSDKFELKEDTAKDREYFKTAMDDEIEEFKELEAQSKKNPEKTEKLIIKRIEKFYQKILSNIELNSSAKKIFSTLPRTAKKNEISSLVHNVEMSFEKLESNVTLADLNLIKNAVLGLKIVIDKLDNPISVVNTRAYNFMYELVDGKIRDRINWYIELISDLDIRLNKELEKYDLALKINDKKLASFQKASIDYLEEYREILTSLLEEYRFFRLNAKEYLLEHRDKGVKHFYKKLNETNAKYNVLNLSLITWKSTHRIAYENRRHDREIYLMELEYKKLIKELNNIVKKYSNIVDPMVELREIFKTEFKAINSITVKLNNYSEVLKENKVKEIQSKINYLDHDLEMINFDLDHKWRIEELAKERIGKTLLTVGLNAEAMNKYPDQFSGGQKQRIGIARTIITKPKFIVADEPISALDVSVQAQVINLLKDLHEEMNLTMLFIAHDLQMVHYISNKIAVIYRGNIVEYGEADKVYKTPIHPYTRTLIAAMPSLTEVGKSLKTSDYKWTDHNYNEFSHPVLHEIEKDHFVFGTEKEIKKWTNKN